MENVLLIQVAKITEVATIRVCEVATFYSMFKQTKVRNKGPVYTWQYQVVIPSFVIWVFYVG